MNEKLREALAIVEKYGMKGDVIYKEIEALAASKQEQKCDTPNYCKSVQRCTAMDQNMASKQEPHPPSRLCMCDDCKPSFEQEPQAQAEPLRVWNFGSARENENGTVIVHILGSHHPEQTDQFITLQSHREAMAGWDVTKRRLESQASHAEQDAQKLRAHCIAYREAIAKKDAALDACALPDSYTSGTCLSYPGRRAEVTLHFSSIEDADRWFAAITSTKDTP